jgi:hypothetical protein
MNKDVLYTTEQLGSQHTRNTLAPNKEIDTPYKWFLAHYTNENVIKELEEDPELKDVIYEDAYAFLCVPYYDRNDRKWGLADDDASMISSAVSSMLDGYPEEDENIATLQGYSDFFYVWELITLPKRLEDMISLRDNVSREMRTLLSWKQQGVYIPQTILELMEDRIDEIKDCDEEWAERVHQEYFTWFNVN